MSKKYGVHQDYSAMCDERGFLNIPVSTTHYMGGCNCWNKTPTVPTCRDPMRHLDDCPAKDSGFPVGQIFAGETRARVAALNESEAESLFDAAVWLESIGQNAHANLCQRVARAILGRASRADAQTPSVDRTSASSDPTLQQAVVRLSAE